MALVSEISNNDNTPLLVLIIIILLLLKVIAIIIIVVIIIVILILEYDNMTEKMLRHIMRVHFLLRITFEGKMQRE